MGGNDSFELAAATEWFVVAGVVVVAVVVDVDSTCRHTIIKDRSGSDVCKKSDIVYVCVCLY